jgi:hypothetical protein
VDRDRPELRLLPGGKDEETAEETVARSKAMHPAGSARRDDAGRDDEEDPPPSSEP